MSDAAEEEAKAARIEAAVAVLRALKTDDERLAAISEFCGIR